MTSQQALALLQASTTFANTNIQDLETLAGLMQVQVCNAGQVIHQEGTPRSHFSVVIEGQVDVIRAAVQQGNRVLISYQAGDVISEGLLVEQSFHTTTAIANTAAKLYVIEAEQIHDFLTDHATFKAQVYENLLKQLVSKLNPAKAHAKVDILSLSSGKSRLEHDLLGDKEVPDYAYFGIQTMRAQENFHITGVPLHKYPELIHAFAYVKKAAAQANFECERINQKQNQAIQLACDELLAGKLHQQFTLDMLQGGAGTSTNMNANEVIANRALELMGFQRGDYQHCHPNNHVNASQSTNDTYPTALNLAMYQASKNLCAELEQLVLAFEQRGKDFEHVLKMGRTQLQDAVPMTLGQEFNAFARTIENEINSLRVGRQSLKGVNMGGTAIGTGINTPEGYRGKVIQYLKQYSGVDVYLAQDLVEATQSTQSFVLYSNVIKSLAIKLSKICNDLRLLASGPRAGIGEIHLPAMQPGSSIMPGKVNPVIPEVVNQVCYKVIGNDLTVTMAAEAGQLQLNVMEPVILQSILESVHMLINASSTLRINCVDGITANEQQCQLYLEKSIGIVTAVVPVLGYETATALAKEALETNRGVVELIREKHLLSEKQIKHVLSPENMT